MDKHYLNVLFLIFWICVTEAYGQTIVYGALNSNVTLNCPYRYSPTDIYTLTWIGPPYNGDTGVTYIISGFGVNPNTVLGNRLGVVGDNTAGEYNMRISNLQQSDDGRYECKYGDNRTYFYLQIKVLLSTVTIDPQSITVTEGGISQVTCTTSDSVPAANITWYIRQQGSTPVQITNGISNTQQNQKTISTLTYTGQKQDNNGIIYCNASQDSIQIKSQNVPISVIYKPSNIQISPSFDPYIVYVSQTGVQLQCSADVGNPPSISYTWSHNGVNSNNNPYVIAVGKNSGGNYTCTASNTAGTVTTSKVVTVQYGPSINPISSQKFIAGRFASVNCNVTSYPEADITWTGPNNLQQTGSTLVFNTTSKLQKGIYTCTTTNTLTPSGQREIHKQQQINVNVDIMYKPEVNDIPSPSIVEGGILNITCSAVANPPVHIYKWTKIGDNTFQQSSETLVITNIRRKHSGKYRCTAMNTMSPTNGQQETGEGHREVTINVKYSPAIIKLGLVGSGTIRNEGETTSLNCGVDSYPTSNVTWASSTGNSRTEYFYKEKNISYYNITTTCLDTGKYKCTASNGIGDKVTNETNLFVRCSPRIDSRYPHKDKIEIKTGKRLSISARYLAYPIANVTWFFSHKNSTDKTKKTLHDSEDGINIANAYYTYWQTSELTKSFMTKDDFGVYTVIFQNYLSLASSVFYVDAERTPDPPTSVKSECLEDSTVNITWQPGFDGGSEQMFIIQYRKSEEKVFMNWTRKLADTNIQMTETIYGLMHGVKYYFRVIAVNSNGETPSDEDPCKTRTSLVTNDSSISVILGSILAVVVVLAVLIIVFILCRKRSEGCTQNSKEGFKSNISDRTSAEDLHPNKADINVYEQIISDLFRFLNSLQL